MGFFDTLGNLASNAGQGMVLGTQYEQQRANLEQVRAQTDSTKTSTAMKQMEMLSMQREVEDRQLRAADFASSTKGMTEGISTQQTIQQGASKAAVMAAARGDFAGAKVMGEMAATAETAIQKQLGDQIKTQQMAKEATSNAAMNYLSNPSPEAASELTASALKAGVNPKTIPMPNDPKFASWAKEQPMAAMTGKEKLDFLQRVKDQDERRAEAKKRDADNLQMRLDGQRQTAMYQQGLLSLKAAALADRAGRDGGKQVKTHPAQVESGIQMIVGSAGEAIRGLDAVADMASTQSGSMFSELKQGNLIEALNRGGTSVITPQSQKLYETAIGGIATEMGRVITGGGGRAGGQQLSEELRKVLRVEPGDSEAVAMYKFTNAVDIVRNRLHYLDRSDSPRMAGLQNELEEQLKNVPTPKQVLTAIKKNPALQKEFNAKAPTLLETIGKATSAVRDADSKVQKGEAAPTSAATPTPGLPAGWK